MNEDCFLPSKTREISKLCKDAELNISTDIIRNGQDRAHHIYNTDEKNSSYIAKENEEICYSFRKETISDVHIVFCSDFINVALAENGMLTLTIGTFKVGHIFHNT